MGGISKDLLHLEQKDSPASALESTLLVCNKKDSHSRSKKPNPERNSICKPVPKSQVLNKVKDIFGVISEANKRLKLDAKDNARDYDIEALTGNESQVIEMDLMLGIADLHTPEAVSAAEAAMMGNQLEIPLPASSSEMETEDGSDDSEDNINKDNDSDDDNKYNKTLFPVNFKRSKTNKDDTFSQPARRKQPKRRPKIVELMINLFFER